MREKAKEIIEGSIANIPVLFNEKDKVAEFAVVALSGEIAMTLRLGLINEDEFEDYMRSLSENFSKLPKY